MLKFIDYAVDAHELERRKIIYHHNFYNRANYVARNFLWYSNDTMANCYYDAKLRDSEYQRLDSVMELGLVKYYGTATMFHFSMFAYMAFFFRYRRLTKLQVAGVGTAYWFAFNQVNEIMYKLCVDKNIINAARAMELNKHIQPNGTHKPRGFNYD